MKTIKYQFINYSMEQPTEMTYGKMRACDLLEHLDCFCEYLQRGRTKGNMLGRCCFLPRLSASSYPVV